MKQQIQRILNQQVTVHKIKSWEERSRDKADLEKSIKEEKVRIGL